MVSQTPNLYTGKHRYIPDLRLTNVYEAPKGKFIRVDLSHMKQFIWKQLIAHPLAEKCREQLK